MLSSKLSSQLSGVSLQGFRRTIHSGRQHDQHIQHCSAAFEVVFPELPQAEQSDLLLATHHFSRFGSIILLSMYERPANETMQNLEVLEKLSRDQGRLELVLHVYDNESRRYNVDHYFVKFKCASQFIENNKKNVLVVLTEV